ncbi:MAG: M48 family metallopeptidase [Christensenellales bacterium]
MELIDEIKIIDGNARISITIDNMGRVVLKHSKDVSKKAIQEFVSNKSEWIQSKKQDKLSSLNNNLNLVNYENLFIFGKKYSLVKSKRNKVENDSIFYTSNKYLLNTLKKISKNQFNERVDLYKSIINVKPVNVILDNAKTRWGVCTNRKEIKINIRAILLPIELFDYVLIHELCHLLQFNHSNVYWNEVEKYCPDYKKCKQDIKNYSFLLDLYR